MRMELFYHALHFIRREVCVSTTGSLYVENFHLGLGYNLLEYNWIPADGKE
jgi:hypothetical protein